MDTLTSMRVFCSVAELRSFTAAANRFGMSPAMASKHVMHLEKRLMARLLNRTSRSVSLTETGTLYFEQVRQMLESLEEVEAAVSRITVAPRGTLRLSAPVWMANPVFSSLLADYRARYPDVKLDIDLSGRLVNLVEEGYDLALRVTAQATLPRGLIARPVAAFQFHLVASPAFLDRTGRPAVAGDLNGRALLMYTMMPGEGALEIDGPGGNQTVTFDPVLLSANETLLHLAALDGMGMTFLPKWMIEHDLASGRLERVMPSAAAFSAQLHAVYPSRRYLSAKVRTFIDFLVADPRMH